MGAAAAIVFVFIGCCSNVVFLELLVKSEPASGHIITCSQFLFIAIEGFIRTHDFGRKKNVIPIKDYLVLVIMFFIVNVTNNVAFAFKISMPLHMIFRSGALIANMIMGIIVLGRRYTLMKYLSVIMITAGTLCCTFASAEDIDEGKEVVDSAEEASSVSTFVIWLSGLGLLTFALFMSARMGLYQEVLYEQHGKHPKEALYYIHILSLPGFILTYESIWEHAMKFSYTEPLEALADVPFLNSAPRMWLFLIGNTLTQYVCISSVFTLCSECTSLTVTLVLTLRKFLSLVFSIIYFQNPFTYLHWVGTMLVFGGTLLFSEVIGKIRDALAPKAKEE
ncbi:UDP-xylose and UDP-N-acetylglucosamine transporter-like isoform X1 [Oratosquilla oratoria]|uniref:UDP-xylose and UDP-N-acetylglucosamine transporter-like isoform X1 n=1 Tax=Oratosquilla oratoria TaxID=337810 RepID=UPI003F77330D